ncbi:hypothetical protein L2089_15550 [Paenibacillus hunanensis]|uniref:hypothetical protein n=1 Tax=Paenibacillus hunanensis TaxID=539262 RepID=UPI002026BF49|nr:hypothetical protein [Paenibacillus hunanensis]MCL9662109.1 hypothetical protein [Paenibacillus hunanensis]
MNWNVKLKATIEHWEKNCLEEDFVLSLNYIDTMNLAHNLKRFSDQNKWFSTKYLSRLNQFIGGDKGMERIESFIRNHVYLQCGTVT